MRALLLHAPGELGLGDVAMDTGPDDWVVVAPALVGLCGSDIHLYDGHVPVRYPVALGHEIVGAVQGGPLAGRLAVIDPVEGCGRCARCRAGTENLCADVHVVGVHRHGGLAERVRTARHRLHLVPDGLSPELAALTEALAVAVHAVNRGDLHVGDTVVVLGGGPIGLMVAITARDRGAARVVVSEPSRRRRALAERLGFEVVDPADGPAVLAEAVGPSKADVVFDAAAHPSLPPTLTALVRSGGTAVVIGLYAGQHPVDLAELVSREIAVVGTRALGRADTPAALDVLTRCGNDLLALIDDVVTPDATMQALERLRRGDVTKVLVDCSSLTE